MKKLGHDSSFRINRKTPLLLLLSLVDTIECVKKFGKKDQEDNGNKSFEALTVLKSIFVFSDKEKIEIDLSEFAKKMKKKGIDKEEYWKSISTLSNWTELKVTEKDDVFTIVLEVKLQAGGAQMAKMGRPKKDNPMDYRVTVRLTEAEKKWLVDVAEEVGLSHFETVKAAL